LVLIGDSDIAYWPTALLPKYSTDNDTLAHGYSGATLGAILIKLQSILSSSSSSSEIWMIVICAGENDIGEGISLDQSIQSLKRILEEILVGDHNLLFLGPKFEPWQHDDISSKQAYAKMSRAFARCFPENLQYINCLTMFCDASSKELPGATLAGRAQADPKYFQSDQLHLSWEGYQLWKDVIEEKING
jgi:lysophospholipase L1-like esterase